MKIQLLRWLTFLTGEKLVRALLFIGIFTVFTMYMESQKEVKRIRNFLLRSEESRRLDERARTDSFSAMIKIIQKECNEKYENYLEEQLDKVTETNKIVNKTIQKNNKLIKDIKRIRNAK